MAKSEKGGFGNLFRNLKNLIQRSPVEAVDNSEGTPDAPIRPVTTTEITVISEAAPFEVATAASEELKLLIAMLEDKLNQAILGTESAASCKANIAEERIKAMAQFVEKLDEQGVYQEFWDASERSLKLEAQKALKVILSVEAQPSIAQEAPALMVPYLSDLPEDQRKEALLKSEEKFNNPLSNKAKNPPHPIKSAEPPLEYQPSLADKIATFLLPVATVATIISPTALQQELDVQITPIPAVPEAVTKAVVPPTPAVFAQVPRIDPAKFPPVAKGKTLKIDEFLTQDAMGMPKSLLDPLAGTPKTLLETATLPQTQPHKVHIQNAAYVPPMVPIDFIPDGDADAKAFKWLKKNASTEVVNALVQGSQHYNRSLSFLAAICRIESSCQANAQDSNNPNMGLLQMEPEDARIARKLNPALNAQYAPDESLFNASFNVDVALTILNDKSASMGLRDAPDATQYFIHQQGYAVQGYKDNPDKLAVEVAMHYHKRHGVPDPDEALSAIRGNLPNSLKSLAREMGCQEFENVWNNRYYESLAAVTGDKPLHIESHYTAVAPIVPKVHFPTEVPPHHSHNKHKTVPQPDHLPTLVPAPSVSPDAIFTETQPLSNPAAVIHPDTYKPLPVLHNVYETPQAATTMPIIPTPARVTVPIVTPDPVITPHTSIAPAKSNVQLSGDQAKPFNAIPETGQSVRPLIPLVKEPVVKPQTMPANSKPAENLLPAQQQIIIPIQQPVNQPEALPFPQQKQTKPKEELKESFERLTPEQKGNLASILKQAQQNINHAEKTQARNDAMKQSYATRGKGIG